MIRFSKASDKEQIIELIELCFGDREKHGAYENIPGRYLLYFDKWGRLVALTGLVHNSEFRSGAEITWTCTHPDYRHKGIMHELFERLLAVTDEDIYCSCWKLSFKDKINLHHLMNDFGFELVLESHKTAIYPHKCDIGEGCPYWGGEGCTCREDLYLRRGKING